MSRSNAARRAPEPNLNVAPRSDAGECVAVQCVALRTVPDAEAAARDTAALEAELLNFSVEDDIQSLVPMPPSIPLTVRTALTEAFGRCFTHYQQLDRWLHRPHPALGSATPFERLVDGDGLRVLRTLLTTRSLRRRGFSIARPKLTVIR